MGHAHVHPHMHHSLLVIDVVLHCIIIQVEGNHENDDELFLDMFRKPSISGFTPANQRFASVFGNTLVMGLDYDDCGAASAVKTFVDQAIAKAPETG